MFTHRAPVTTEELREMLRDTAASGQTIELGGNFSKRTMGGEITPADVAISTRALDRMLVYEPKDLTVSVQAGMKIRDLSAALAANQQMLPLDPPFFEDATVGGVIASNCSGPRRRRYGTARDMVIGMKFYTLAGKEIQTGGMVVKNVTGLDMGKLMIGSFGTLACVGSVNFKVFPLPELVSTFVLSSDSLDELVALRRELIGGILQPIAIDLLNTQAVQYLGFDLPAKYSLLVEMSGNRSLMDRYRREFEKLASSARAVTLLALEGAPADSLWRAIRDLTPTVLQAQPESVVLRIATQPASVSQLFKSVGSRAILARAGAGVAYVYCPSLEDARACLTSARSAGLAAVVEHAPVAQKSNLESWANPGSEVEIMRLIKQRFDPKQLLNAGRLYSRI